MLHQQSCAFDHHFDCILGPFRTLHHTLSITVATPLAPPAPPAPLAPLTTPLPWSSENFAFPTNKSHFLCGLFRAFRHNGSTQFRKCRSFSPESGCSIPRERLPEGKLSLQRRQKAGLGAIWWQSMRDP
jgi:hypothetical protein